MAKMIKTTFRLKRGNASVWASKNPVLDPGEPGFEIDTGKLKIGNGTSAWNDLAYLAGESEGSTPAESESGIEFVNIEFDVENEDEFTNITADKTNVDLYNILQEGKYIIAKAAHREYSSPVYLPLVSVRLKGNSSDSAFTFSGMVGTEVVVINLGSDEIRIEQGELADSDEVDRLSNQLSSLQTTVSNLPRGIRFLGKGNVLPPFDGGEIENGDIYLVGDKEYIAYNETWYELGDYGAYVTQSDLNTKVDKVSGKGLSTEDYTTAEKNKLAGIDMSTKANAADLGDLAYRSLGAVSDSNTTSPPSGAAVKEAIDAATSEVGAFVEDAINQAIIGAMNASY